MHSQRWNKKVDVSEIFFQFFLSFPRMTGSCDMAFIFQVDGTAVGFMSLCSDVNVSLFQECFDLGPFHGLCKPHPEDILKMPGRPSIQEGIYILKC